MRGDFSQLPEVVQVACFGAFFAMAKADGHIHEREVDLIFAAVEGAGLSEEAEREIHAYRQHPPSLGHSLWQLGDATTVVRVGVLAQLVEVGWADGVLRWEERAALVKAAQLLRLEPELVPPLVRCWRLKSQGAGSQAIQEARGILQDRGVPEGALSYFDLDGGHDEFLDGLLRAVHERDRAKRFQSMAKELGQLA